jgi:hypothetical protein
MTVYVVCISSFLKKINETANVKNWQCCLNRKPIKLRRVFPLASVWGRTVEFNAVFAIYTLLIIRLSAKEINPACGVSTYSFYCLLRLRFCDFLIKYFTPSAWELFARVQLVCCIKLCGVRVSTLFIWLRIGPSCELFWTLHRIFEFPERWVIYWLSLLPS